VCVCLCECPCVSVRVLMCVCGRERVTGCFSANVSGQKKGMHCYCNDINIQAFCIKITNIDKFHFNISGLVSSNVIAMSNNKITATG